VITYNAGITITKDKKGPERFQEDGQSFKKDDEPSEQIMKKVEAEIAPATNNI